jgi:hypothetical protein
LTTEHAQEIIKAREKKEAEKWSKKLPRAKKQEANKKARELKLKVLLPVGVSVDGKQSFRGSSLMI